MQTSKYYAQKTLLENGICSLPVETDTIITILKNEGYNILNTENHIDIIKSILKDKCFDFIQKPAFTISSDNIKAVFYRLSLTAEEKREALAHELAHIKCGHMSTGNILGYCDDCTVMNRQELEAQEFMREFLAPVCILKKLKVSTLEEIERLSLLSSVNSAKQYANCSITSSYKTTTEKELINSFTKQKKHFKIIICSLLLSIILSLFISAETKDSNTAPTPTQITPSPTPSPATITQTENYIITSSGKKYHMPDCQYVKYKTNITSVTIDQARSLNKTPCLVCIKN